MYINNKINAVKSFHKSSISKIKIEIKGHMNIKELNMGNSIYFRALLEVSLVPESRH